MFYILLGGAGLGVLYKAVNTMDSMIGYKNGRYLSFGRAAARLDDALGYLPSRLAALLIIFAASVTNRDSGALRIWRRDRRNHESPNSAQTMSACAGALGVRLAGPASYAGVPRVKPYIGDDLRPVDPEDIRRANSRGYVSASVMLLIAVTARGIFYAFI
jgi:adenosylcobinamide-phosphate synthase